MLLRRFPFSTTAGSNTCSPHVSFRKRRKWARLSNFVGLFFSAGPHSLPPPPSLFLSYHPSPTKATFFVNSPHLHVLTFHFLSLHDTIAYTSLYYTRAAGSVKVKRMSWNITWCRRRHRGTSSHHSITPLLPICLLHAQCSPLKPTMKRYLFLMPPLYTSAPRVHCGWLV